MTARPSSPPDRFHTLVFVAHGGPLEAKSALLAASLADYYRPGRIACSVMQPEDHWGALSPETAQLFGELGVEMRPCENAIDPDYPHGNKITALAGIHGPAIFLDSDILLMAPFSWHYSLSGDAALKPADMDTFQGKGGSWARVWELFDMDLPPKSYTATINGEKMRPYFNAGFIVVRDGDSFAQMWCEVAQKIDAEARIVNKRPWLDQVALPVALARLGWQPRELSEAFNYPCHLTQVGPVPPYFAHYHWPEVIAGNAPLLYRTRQLVHKYPGLRPILSRYEEWDPVLRALDG